MSTRSAELETPALEVELWLDYDPAVQRLPGIALGVRGLRAPARSEVTELHRSGVRCVRLVEPVALCRDAPAAAAQALLFVREATSQGLAVRWRARCADGCAASGLFHHLYPPQEVLGAPPEVAARWRDGYFPSRCVFRRGPGFVEVRDRRFGTLELFTIDDPEHLAEIEALSEGAEAGRLPAAVRRDFTEAGLITEQAGLAWWLPMRVRRWPFPSLTV
ncbi:DUF5825 family protein [Kitasatospora viridis]|uniref:Uncharacterized protein n=1 Tax=Kitasatospora viridis TaxID=281105 RepID=A0A561SFN7_9ACTN|nr:DUF5825 family protein [Kitasatospora viridis]TWF73682.1 hypothetical protein FHX73_15298 [Kitasatospora viridis]